MNFHLPYHFVPFEQPSEKDRLTVEQYLKNPGEATHAAWKTGTHSGRIVCRLETVTPIFIGSHRADKEPPASVGNYMLNGEIAIPASSLRGMVSSLAEAASNSALRVLNTRARYSVRKQLDPEYVLSAIGMIRGNKETGYKLQPLCIPTLRADRDGVARLPEDYQGLFPEPNLKVYLGDYNSIRSSNYLYRTFRLDAPEWWAMPLQRRSWLPGFRLPDDEYQHRKPISTRNFVLGQDPMTPRATPVKWQELGTRVAEADRSRWVPGVMRVLGCWGNREKSEMIPTGKKHELFLPWPANPNWPVIPINDQVVEEFHALCDARTEASWSAYCRDSSKHPLLPFEPKDTRNGRNGPQQTGEELNIEKRGIRLKDGDLVYFAAGKGGAITEISFSAVWRKPVRCGGKPTKSGEFFPSEFWPFHPDRKTLSPAELLFGFVKDSKGVEKEDDKKTPRALASRVRFSAAVLQRRGGANPLLDEVTLKILDSPKPPCPALYFRPRGNAVPAFIGKMDLDAAKHEAQGRKYYLHQPASDRPWETKKPKEDSEQKTRIHPIAEGQAFYFHVDFENLSDEELGLLLFALAPFPDFRHKIGMGKAIGLGSIRLTPVGLFQIDRCARYTPEGLNGARYHEARIAQNASSDDWPARYVFEKEAARKASAGGIEALREPFLRSVNPRIRKAIELVGDPRYVKASVQPPLLDGQTPESETFKWFVVNERERAQFLRPLGNRQDLPLLTQLFGEVRETKRRY